MPGRTTSAYAQCVSEPARLHLPAGPSAVATDVRVRAEARATADVDRSGPNSGRTHRHLLAAPSRRGPQPADDRRQSILRDTPESPCDLRELRSGFFHCLRLE